MAVGEGGSVCSTVECLRDWSTVDDWDPGWQLASAFCSDSLIDTCSRGLLSASVGAHSNNNAAKVVAVILNHSLQ